MPSRLPMSRQIERRKVHRSKKEIEHRISTEAKTMSSTDSINAPSYLTLPSEQEEFVRLAEQLAERGQYDTRLDEDTLARYVQAHRFYLAFTDRLNLAEQNDADSTELARLQRVQDSFFKQCRACAADLGLTVTARAKLSVPAHEDEGEYEL